MSTPSEIYHQFFVLLLPTWIEGQSLLRQSTKSCVLPLYEADNWRVIRGLLQVTGGRVVDEVCSVKRNRTRTLPCGPPYYRQAFTTHSPGSPHAGVGWSGCPISRMLSGGPLQRDPVCPSEVLVDWCWKHWRNQRTWSSQSSQASPDETELCPVDRARLISELQWVHRWSHKGAGVF